MKKTILTLLVSLLLVQPALASKEYDYNEVLKKHKKFSKLANHMLVVSKSNAVTAEKVAQSGDLDTVLKTRNELIKGFEKLKEQAELLGGPFDEPYGQCGLLPQNARQYSISLLASVLSGRPEKNIDLYHQHYKEVYARCKSQYENEPEDKSDLAIIDVG